MSKTMEMPVNEADLKPVEVAPPVIQGALTIAQLKEMADELAAELNTLYVGAQTAKLDAERMFKEGNARQAELLEAFYQKTGVKFQPKFKENFTVEVII